MRHKKKKIASILTAGALAATVLTLSAGPAGATAYPFKPHSEPTITTGSGSNLTGDNDSALVTHCRPTSGAPGTQVTNNKGSSGSGC